MPEETPKACIPFLLASLPLSPGHIPIPATPLCGGCFHHRWGDPKEEAGGGNPITWRHGAQGLSRALPAQTPRPLGVVGVVSLQEGPPGSGGCGPVQRGAGTQACGAGLIGRHISPSSVAPRQSIWEPRLQGCASSPGHQIGRAHV